MEFVLMTMIVGQVIGVDGQVEFDDPTIQELWNRRVELRPASSYWHDGRWRKIGVEIGPPGVKETDGGNSSFPWAMPAGRLNKSVRLFGADVGFSDYTMVRKRERRISYGSGRFGWVAGAVGPTWKWNVGTCFMEVHYMHGVIISVRTRLKTALGWEFEVFRPIIEHSELRLLSNSVGEGVVVKRSFGDGGMGAFEPKEVLLLDDGLSDKEYVSLIDNIVGLRASLGVNYGKGAIDRLWKTEPIWLGKAVGCTRRS